MSPATPRPSIAPDTSTRLVDPRILACAAMTVLLGLAIGYLIAPNAWAVDIDRTLRGGRTILDGTYGSERGYLYSPLAALATVPLTWLPVGVAVIGWLVAKLVILGWGAVQQSRGLRRADIVLVAAAAVFFLPTVHDLVLGNVSVFVAAAVALMVWRKDSPWTGIALGLVLATVPKPQLVPILLWAGIFRPRALIGAVVAAGVLTLFGIVALGIEPYRVWVGLLRTPEYLDGRPTYGNLALSGWDPRLAIPLSITAILAMLYALRRGFWPGLVACICIGLLVAPYTMAYAAVLLLLVARPLAIVAPRATMLLVLVAPVAVIVAFPIWVAAILAIAVAVPGERWRLLDPAEERAPRWSWTSRLVPAGR